YALRSSHPLNPKNLPATAEEAKGLAAIAQPPHDPYYTEELLGGRYYFTAVYPQTATSRACLACHHPMATRASQPPHLGEVLGGLVVRVALEL
ncbi:MAG: DUF3365 domain-containing protein, partial [Verrucomicrobia bacterium]|nr:DUF3365 domain-containing protein [Verrucomicrobiota bacterium]